MAQQASGEQNDRRALGYSKEISLALASIMGAAFLGALITGVLAAFSVVSVWICITLVGVSLLSLGGLRSIAVLRQRENSAVIESVAPKAQKSTLGTAAAVASDASTVYSTDMENSAEIATPTGSVAQTERATARVSQAETAKGSKTPSVVRPVSGVRRARTAPKNAYRVSVERPASAGQTVSKDSSAGRSTVSAESVSAKVGREAPATTSEEKKNASWQPRQLPRSTYMVAPKVKRTVRADSDVDPQVQRGKVSQDPHITRGREVMGRTVDSSTNTAASKKSEQVRGNSSTRISRDTNSREEKKRSVLPASEKKAETVNSILERRRTAG